MLFLKSYKVYFLLFRIWIKSVLSSNRYTNGIRSNSFYGESFSFLYEDKWRLKTKRKELIQPMKFSNMF